MSTIGKDLEYVDSAAAESINNAATIRIEETTLDVGQFVPQGDVALFRLDSVPDDAELVENPNPQIAPGDTQGSRHVWDSMDGITVYRRSNNTSPLVGDIYKLDKERTLTHPEHGHHVYHAGFIGECHYQRSDADELRRIMD